MRQSSILITGASSGIGLATALYFQNQGWKVVAALRTPDKAPAELDAAGIAKVRMDVTDAASVKAAVSEALNLVDSLDVLVNNAGYGLAGVFEACSEEQVRKQFNTNVFGLFEVTRALLPHFRRNRRGTIINISSVGGRTTIPLYSLYHASKFAVEGFTESLRFELEPFNIQVRLIEPGAVKTEFAGRSAEFADITHFADYKPYQERVLNALKKAANNGAPAEEVARDIYKAATDGGSRLRYVSGSQAKMFLFLQNILPSSVYSGLLKRQFG